MEVIIFLCILDHTLYIMNFFQETKKIHVKQVENISVFQLENDIHLKYFLNYRQTSHGLSILIIN